MNIGGLYVETLSKIILFLHFNTTFMKLRLKPSHINSNKLNCIFKNKAVYKHAYFQNSKILSDMKKTLTILFTIISFNLSGQELMSLEPYKVRELDFGPEVRK